jgi:hypothetical protein
MGEAVLKGLSPTDAAEVRQIAEYRKAIPMRYLNSPRGAKILGLVEQFTGEAFDQAKYTMRQRALTGFTSGRQGDALRSLNQAAGHLDTTYEKARALANGNTALWNKIANYGLQQTGDPRVDGFLTAAGQAGGEMAKFMKGTGSPTEGEMELLQSKLSAAKSPAQIAEVLGTMAELAEGSLNAYKHQWEIASNGAPFTMVSPEADRALSKLRLMQRLMAGVGTNAGTRPVTAHSALPPEIANNPKRKEAEAYLTQHKLPVTAENLKHYYSSAP